MTLTEEIEAGIVAIYRVYTAPEKYKIILFRKLFDSTTGTAINKYCINDAYFSSKEEINIGNNTASIDSIDKEIQTLETIIEELETKKDKLEDINDILSAPEEIQEINIDDIEED